MAWVNFKRGLFVEPVPRAGALGGGAAAQCLRCGRGLGRDAATGVWSAQVRRDLSGRYYSCLVEVFAPGAGLVCNRVTDPCSLRLNADSQRSWHLKWLADAGLTDVHLLSVFDFASVPESACLTSKVSGSSDSPVQQAQVMAAAATDCFNWGYDPWHFGAPEGSHASDADDGARRIVEFRRTVQALHGAGLRVGMDRVYNQTSASGQNPKSVLDRIVPGYYQRLDAAGAVEHSTCCENTATEHRMMARLMIDTTRVWAREHGIDSFRC